MFSLLSLKVWTSTKEIDVISFLLFNYGGELFNNESKTNSEWQIKEKTTCTTNSFGITSCTTKEKQ